MENVDPVPVRQAQVEDVQIETISVCGRHGSGTVLRFYDLQVFRLEGQTQKAPDRRFIASSLMTGTVALFATTVMRPASVYRHDSRDGQAFSWKKHRGCLGVHR